MTPIDANEARISVLENQVKELQKDDARIEQALLDSLRRLEKKFDEQISSGMSRVDARALARAYALASMAGTGLIAALAHIAVNL